MKILKSTIAGLCIIYISILLTGCATTNPSIMTDIDREADFSQYTTYYWSDEFQVQNGNNGEQEPLFYNTLIKKRLKNAIQAEMEGRGYRLSSDDPDLLVNAHVVVQERNTNQNYTAYPYYGYYHYGSYYDRESGSTKEGDIVIDLIDKDQHQLVWQGYARGVLEATTTDREEDIREAVSLIFGEYGLRAGEGIRSGN